MSEGVNGKSSGNGMEMDSETFEEGVRGLVKELGGGPCERLSNKQLADVICLQARVHEGVKAARNSLLELAATLGGVLELSAVVQHKAQMVLFGRAELMCGGGECEECGADCEEGGEDEGKQPWEN